MRSRPELGSEGLARKSGHRSPAKLIAATTGGHLGDAARLLQVGEATRERTLLSGQAAPPAHPHVAAAVSAGLVSVPVAAAITSMLDRIAVRVAPPVRDVAEKTIVEQTHGLALDDVQAVLRRAEAHLDPDGLEPRIDELRGHDSLTPREDRAGMTVITARLDPAIAAPVIAAIEGIVTHQLRVSRGRNTPDGVLVESSDAAATPADRAASDGARREVADALRTDGLRTDSPEPVAAETRSVAQLRAAALSEICRARRRRVCDDRAGTVGSWQRNRPSSFGPRSGWGASRSIDRARSTPSTSA